jgi:hypothetical protein
MGSAISQLRADGLIMTDLDVKISLLNEVKIAHLLGETPMKYVFEEIENQKSKVKQIPWKEFPKYFRKDKFSSLIPEHKNLRELLRRYYEVHLQRPFISSFHYQDKVKIFPAHIVRDFMISLNKGLRSEIVAQLPIERRLKLPFKTKQKAAQLTVAQKWIESGSLSQLLKNPLPPGIGPDDSRIARTIFKILDDSTLENVTQVLLVVTEDQNLYNDLRILLHRMYEQKRWIFATLTTSAYIKYCYRRKRPGKINIFNWIRQQETSIDDLIPRIIANRFENQIYELTPIFDIPNIQRNLEIIEQDSSGTLYKHIQGFLPIELLRSLNEEGWAHQPFEKLRSWKCWDRGVKIIEKYNYEISERTLKVHSNDLPLWWR